MSKRPATGQLQPAGSPKRHEGIPGDRARLFTARLVSLNLQFADWIKDQAANHPKQLWLDGCQHYEEYIDDVLDEFCDIIGNDAIAYRREVRAQREEARSSRQEARDTLRQEVRARRQADGPEQQQEAEFATPQAAAAAGGRGVSTREQPTATRTGGSTGRKSVTWADDATALTPPPAAASGTPNPNTANAGHTPVPPGFGRSTAATAGEEDAATPSFKLSSTPAATAAPATGADAAAAGGYGRGLFGRSDGALAAAAGTPPASGTAATKAPVGSSGGGFGFGGGSFGTPVSTAGAATAEKDVGGSSSSTPYMFGTPAGAAAAAAAGGGGFGDGQTAAGAPVLSGFGTPVSTAGGEGGARVKSHFGGSSTAGKGKEAPAGAGPFSFSAVPQGSSKEGISSPAFAWGTASSSAAAGSNAAAAAGADKGKAPAAGFGAISSSSSAPGAASTAAGSSAPPAFSFGMPPAGGSTFNVPSSSAAAGAGSSSPAFGFATAGASSSGMFGFGAAGSAPAAAAGGGAAPGFGAAAAFSGPAGGFKFPTASEAAGAGAAAAAAAAAAGEEEADEEEVQEEPTAVLTDGSLEMLWKSKELVLHIQRKGQTNWEPRGRCTASFRRNRTNQNVYVFVMNQAGKQLASEQLLPNTKTARPGTDEPPPRVLMNMRVLFTSVKPGGGEGRMPEAVMHEEVCKACLRFGGEESRAEFENKVQEYKPSG